MSPRKGKERRKADMFRDSTAAQNDWLQTARRQDIRNWQTNETNNVLAHIMPTCDAVLCYMQLMRLRKSRAKIKAIQNSARK